LKLRSLTLFSLQQCNNTRNALYQKLLLEHHRLRTQHVELQKQHEQLTVEKEQGKSSAELSSQPNHKLPRQFYFGS